MAANVIRGGTTAAAHEIDQPGGGKLAQDGSHFRRGFVVAAKRVGQPGVGIARDETVGDPRQLLNVGAHGAATEGAVDADGKRAGVTNAGEERFGRLARKRPAGGVGDGHADHHGETAAHFLKDPFDRKQGGLGVQGVKDGFDQKRIDAPVEQVHGPALNRMSTT
jgi:hypothetical protein